jgi:hypothetical protein
MATMSDGTTDQAVLDHIQRLVAEEEQIFGRGAKSDADRERLQSLGVALDQAWDLLRQRRALREFGRDPSEAQVRPPGVVEKYIG